MTTKELIPIISESIQKYMNEQRFNKAVERAVNESVKKHLRTINEDEEKDDDDDNNDAQERFNDNHGHKSNKRRKRVIEYLKNASSDCAPYAYKLWPDTDEDTARGYFYKCRDNEYGARFSDDEINRLYSMISSNSI